jgi:hypothetical protein
MIRVFSQIVYKDDKEFIYECSVNEDDLVTFTYGSSNNLYISLLDYNTPGIDEILSSISIDFLTLRNIIDNESKEDSWIKYEIKGKYSKHSIEENNEFIKISDDNSEILLTKNFIRDSYEILKNIWEEDE